MKIINIRHVIKNTINNLQFMASKSCSFIRIHRTPAHTPMKKTGILEKGCAVEIQYPISKLGLYSKNKRELPKIHSI